MDGKKYGPFQSKYRPNITRIENLRGVAVEDVWLFTGWLEFEQPKQPRARRDKTTPLFDGLDFTPVPKQKGWQIVLAIHPANVKITLQMSKKWRILWAELNSN